METQFGSTTDLRREIRQDDGAEPEVVRRSFDGGDDRFDIDSFVIFRQKDFPGRQRSDALVTGRAALWRRSYPLIPAICRDHFVRKL